MPFDPTPSPGLIDLHLRIANLPRIAGRVQWQTDLPLVLDLVRVVQPTRPGEQVAYRAASLSGALGLSEQTLLRFAAGRRAGGQPWLELRDALKSTPAPAAPEPEPEVAAAPAAPLPEPPVEDRRSPSDVAIDEAVALFGSVPPLTGRGAPRRDWEGHPEIVARALGALHRAGNTMINRALIAGRGVVPLYGLELMLCGALRGKPWPELRKVLADLGVPCGELAAEKTQRRIREQVAAHDAPRTEPVPAFTVTRPEPTPGPLKPTALVVRDGVVAIVEAPPPAPAAMVAKPGDYARKTETTNPPTLVSSQTTKSAKTDPDSGDLFLTTTTVTVTRVAYGTPEHLILSKARAATCAAKSAA